MTATIALPRQPHSDWLARLRTIGLGLGGRRVVGLGVAQPEASTETGNGLLNSLVGYWPGNEASGNLLDAHTGGKTFTDQKTVTTAAGLVYAAARQHTAATNEYFQRVNDSAFHQDADWSFATWIRHDTIGSQQTIYYTSGNLSHFAWLALDAFGAGKMGFRMYATTGADTNVLSSNYGNIPAETWIAVVITYTASTRGMTLSINAGSRNAGTLSAAPRVSASSLSTIFGQSAGRPFNGRMGPTAYWSRAISTVDETAWYNAGAGLAYAQFTT